MLLQWRRSVWMRQCKPFCTKYAMWWITPSSYSCWVLSSVFSSGGFSFCIDRVMVQVFLFVAKARPFYLLFFNLNWDCLCLVLYWIVLVIEPFFVFFCPIVISCKHKVLINVMLFVIVTELYVCVSTFVEYFFVYKFLNYLFYFPYICSLYII